MSELDIGHEIMHDCIKRFRDSGIGSADVANYLSCYLVVVVDDYYPYPESAEGYTVQLIYDSFKRIRELRAEGK